MEDKSAAVERMMESQPRLQQWGQDGRHTAVRGEEPTTVSTRGAWAVAGETVRKDPRSSRQVPLLGSTQHPQVICESAGNPPLGPSVLKEPGLGP